MIIAIDGPAASGKGTLGKKLAAHYGFRHLDTGLLYRAVAKALLDAGHPAGDETRAIAAAQGDRSGAASTRPRSSATRSARRRRSSPPIPGVRAALFDFQQKFAAAPPGAVLDGRDIGTVICPERRGEDFRDRDARGPRRPPRRELRGRGENADEKAILADIIARDERDRSRATAPLMQAPDAHLLDTTSLDIDAAFAAALAAGRAARRYR